MSVKNTYMRMYKKEDGYRIKALGLDIPGVSFVGKIDEAYQWHQRGQIISADDYTKGMLAFKKFDIVIYRTEPNDKEFALRLIACTLDEESDSGLINIERVIFWRPREIDEQEPHWKKKANVFTQARAAVG